VSVDGSNPLLMYADGLHGTKKYEALSNLRNLLRDHSSDLAASTSRKEWSMLFDKLFEIATAEKASYVKSSRPLTARLEACRLALKASVRAGVSKIRQKTVRALIDHVVQLLWTNDGLFEPLSIDYLSSLSLVLAYQPHVERLQEDWHTVLTFCLDSLNHICQDEALTLHGSRRLGSRPNLPRSQMIKETDGLITCIAHLCEAPNAPIQDRGSEIANSVIGYLRWVTPRMDTNIGGMYGMRTINYLAGNLAYSNVEWAKHTVNSLLPLLSELWTVRLPPRDEIIIFLTHTHLYISNVMKNEEPRESLLQLQETMRSDYFAREPRQQLKFGDISLEPRQVALDAARTFGHVGDEESELSWGTVHFIAYIGALFDLQDSPEGSASDRVAKKKRKGSSQLDSLFRETASASIYARMGSWQTLAFYIQFRSFSPHQIAELLDAIISEFARVAAEQAPWVLLSFCQCAHQKHASSSRLDVLWTQVWELAARLIPSTLSSRAASHVLDTLLRQGLVQYSQVSKSIDQMLAVSELSGPAVLGESSVSLWISSLSLRLAENPGSSRGLSEKLLRWLFKKWTPSMLPLALIDSTDI
jgi:ataxia telangiectasia mutated family protein